MQANQLQLSDSPFRQDFYFGRKGSQVTRSLEAFGGNFEHSIENSSGLDDAAAAYFQSLLNGKKFTVHTGARRVKYIDLFCGGGGLSLGLQNALKTLGLKPSLVLAADIDRAALRLVREHFGALTTRDCSVEDLVEYAIDYSGGHKQFLQPPQITDPAILANKGKVDLLIGGPPCQGHSNLNNKTRRSDPRNLLYFVMPAFAVALEIPNIVIENVPTIQRAKENVVELSRSLLRSNGYQVEEIILNASDYGVAQSRRRHFLVASKSSIDHLFACASSIKTPHLSFEQINGRLLDRIFPNEMIETNGKLSEENVTRINHLHDNDVHNLQNDLRPDCHKESHTYPSVYGRIHGHLPAQTITTGFSSPGRGRYIHPTERRTITVREAARLQAFPDWYWQREFISELSRAQLTKIIGDAVPGNMIDPIAITLFSEMALQNRGAA